VHGRDGVRVCPSSLLEYLVDPAVWQRPARSGEAIELEAHLLGGEQALPRVLGIRIGGDQPERGEVIAGDPGGAVSVEHVGSVPQTQPEPVMLHDAHRQNDVLGERAARVGRPIEHGLEQRRGQTQLTPEIIDRSVLMRQQF
jgi:hypothetical protein